MKYYDAKTGTMVEEVEDLTKRQWPSRMLIRFNDISWNEKGHCACCNEPIQKWKGEYFGTFSDCNTLYDFEYSYFTNYCENCAKKEAERTRNSHHPVCPPVVEHIDNIRDGGYYCERTVYADGMIVESTGDSIRKASEMWR